MRTILPKIAYAALVAFLVVPASGDVINFDDINASAGDVALDTLSPYQGFKWTNFSVYTNTPGFPGFNNGIISSPNAAYTAGDTFGVPVVSTITEATPFNFVSADLGSGWYDGLEVTVNGFLNGTMLFSHTITVNTNGAQLFTFNFTGINQIDLFSTITGSTLDSFGCGATGCSQVTLDDLTITQANTNVPEPSTGRLAGFAIAVLLFASRLKYLSS